MQLILLKCALTSQNKLVMNTHLVNIKKILVFVISLILCANALAQNETDSAKVFVRVYNLQNKKIGKGKLVAIKESSLQLIRNKKIKEFSTVNIGTIKTKRSDGYNILIGTITGATAIGIAVASDTNANNAFFSVEGDILAGAIMGGTAGVAIGGITCLFKNSVTYEINGDMEKWKAFKIMMHNNKVLNKH